MKLIFETVTDYAILVEYSKPELSNLVDKDFTPGFLLKRHSKFGVHLMPKDEYAKLACFELNADLLKKELF